MDFMMIKGEVKHVWRGLAVLYVVGAHNFAE
jgi:hypothetical protein